MMNDLSLKIKRSKERLLLTQMEQAAAAGMSKQQQEEVEMKIQILTDKINHLVDQAEKAGCQVDYILTRHLLFQFGTFSLSIHCKTKTKKVRGIYQKISLIFKI